eukprot:1970-Heterococcus_DN1.PRE.2
MVRVVLVSAADIRTLLSTPAVYCSFKVFARLTSSMTCCHIAVGVVQRSVKIGFNLSYSSVVAFSIIRSMQAFLNDFIYFCYTIANSLSANCVIYAGIPFSEEGQSAARGTVSAAWSCTSSTVHSCFCCVLEHCADHWNVSNFVYATCCSAIA